MGLRFEVKPTRLRLVSLQDHSGSEAHTAPDTTAAERKGNTLDYFHLSLATPQILALTVLRYSKSLDSVREWSTEGGPLGTP